LLSSLAIDAQQILKFLYLAWEKEKDGSNNRRNSRVTLAFRVAKIILQYINCSQAPDKKQPRSVLVHIDVIPPGETHCKHK